MVILILLRSMRGSGTLVFDTDWSTNSSTTTLSLDSDWIADSTTTPCAIGLVVDEQLTKLGAGLRVHVLELTGGAVEHLVEVLVDLVRLDAGQDLRIGDSRRLGLLARIGHLPLLPQRPAQECRTGKCDNEKRRECAHQQPTTRRLRALDFRVLGIGLVLDDFGGILIYLEAARLLHRRRQRRLSTSRIRLHPKYFHPQHLPCRPPSRLSYRWSGHISSPRKNVSAHQRGGSIGSTGPP